MGDLLLVRPGGQVPAEAMSHPMTGTREPEEAEMLRIRLIRHLVTWSLGLFFAAQALVISILLGIDAQN